MDKEKALKDIVESIDEAIRSLEIKNPELFESTLFFQLVLNGLAHSLIKYGKVGGLDCNAINNYLKMLWDKTFDYH